MIPYFVIYCCLLIPKFTNLLQVMSGNNGHEFKQKIKKYCAVASL